MNQNPRNLAVLGAVALLSGCSGIGKGNAPESLEIRVNDIAESAELFECLAGTAQARLAFNDGSAGDFARRSGAVWSSSDETVLRVSDGSIPASDTEFFVNGTLLPVKAGTAVLTVKYLNFEDSIPVTVKPLKIELSPHQQTLAQGNRVFMRSTGVLSGDAALSVLDMSSLGDWSVTGSAGADAASTIDRSSGLIAAVDGAAGTDTVNFSIDFCNRQQSVPIQVVNQTLSSIELVLADAPDQPLSSIAVPPDASIAVHAIGHYSGGLKQNLTGLVSFQLSDSAVGYASARGTGVITSVFEAPGQSAALSAVYDPDSSIEGDEITSNSVEFKVLDVSLQADSLAVTPQDALMLLGTGRAYQVNGRFSGTDGEIDWNLTRDVLWTSSDTALLLMSNQNGSRGFALSSVVDRGIALASALRSAGDGPEVLPTARVTIGAADDAGSLLDIRSITVSGGNAELSSGSTLALTAEARIANETLSGTQDITTSVVWSSSDESVAVVGNASGSKGVVTVVTTAQDQKVTITAAYFDTSQQADAVMGSLELSVNPAPATN